MDLAYAFALAALALAIVSIMVWRRGGSGVRRAATTAFLDHQLERHRDQPAVAAESRTRRRRTGLRAWDDLLLRAGITAGAGFHLRFFAPIVAVPLALLGLAGPIAAVAALALTAVLSYFRLWLKAAARQRRMLSQLPAFLEAMVRLITIGNSIGAAFQAAAANADFPLKEVLQRAENLTRSGKEIDAALRQVSEQYGLRQLYLMAAVIAVALRFGGRSDQVLDRMAAFMRDLEHARDELSAMSAEVRMSAWILALLPLGLAAFIIIFNNALFMTMWADPAGVKLLIGAAILQAGGSYWLYRMARAI